MCSRVADSMKWQRIILYSLKLPEKQRADEGWAQSLLPRPSRGSQRRRRAEPGPEVLHSARLGEVSAHPEVQG